MWCALVSLQAAVSAGKRGGASIQAPAAQPAPAAPINSPLVAYLRCSGPARAETNAAQARGQQPGVPAAPAAAAGAATAVPSVPRHRASQPWLSPREGAGLWVSLDDGCEGGDSLSAADAQRCQALLHVSENAEVTVAEPQPQPLQAVSHAAAPRPAPSAVVSAAAAAASVPMGGAPSGPACAGAAPACPESVGSVATARPKRARWACNAAPGAASGPRRPLSSLAAPVAEGEPLLACEMLPGVVQTHDCSGSMCPSIAPTWRCRCCLCRAGQRCPLCAAQHRSGHRALHRGVHRLPGQHRG